MAILDRFGNFFLIDGEIVFGNSIGYHEDYLRKRFHLPPFFAKLFTFLFPRGAGSYDTYDNNRLIIEMSPELASFQERLIERWKISPQDRPKWVFNEPHYKVDPAYVAEKVIEYTLYEDLDQPTIEFVHQYLPQIYTQVVRKVAQRKPMALPVAPPNEERVQNRGIGKIDDVMTEFTARDLQQMFPDIEYGGAGAIGIAFRTGSGEMSKVTADEQEVSAARIAYYDNLDWVVPIVDEPQQIQDDPPLWLIKMKELKILPPNEQNLVTYLCVRPDETNMLNINRVMNDMVAYVDVDRILKIYEQVKHIKQQNAQSLWLTDIHGGNVGWDQDGRLKVFDFGSGH